MNPSFSSTFSGIPGPFQRQENVLVGGFFVISGYVSAYTSTKLGARGVEEKKVANPELFFWQRVTWRTVGSIWDLKNLGRTGHLQFPISPFISSFYRLVLLDLHLWIFITMVCMVSSLGNPHDFPLGCMVLTDLFKIYS